MAKISIPLTDIVPFLAARFGAVSGLGQIAEGEESQAFAFEADGAALILRINADDAGFAKDRLARRFDRAALPVPDVRLIAPLGAVFACVSDRASGVTLQDLRTGGARAYAGAVAAALDGIAGSDLTGFRGFGPFDARGQGRAATWGEWLAEATTPAFWGQDPAMHDHTVVAQAITAVAGFATTVADHRQLVHGDFGSNNVICDNGRITAVIDWSEAMIGDPLYDLANILFWRTWLDCMDMQARYVEEEQPARLAEQQRLRIYQLHIGLCTLAGATGDRVLTDWTLGRLTTLLADG